MIRACGVVAVLALCLVVSDAALVKAWMDTTMTPVQRAKTLLTKMNDTEKYFMLHGQGWGNAYVGYVPANTRLGIPSLNLNDGPQGFRNSGYSNSDDHPGTSTQWPSGMSIGMSWSTDDAYAWNQAIAAEFRGKGANVALGPAMCVSRVPRNGRTFEYMTGEDPFLGYTLVQPAIKGFQDNGIIANAKHFVANNQETNRNSVSENVDERTLMEVYVPAFEGAVEAGVGSFMCGYNKVNHVFNCENSKTMGIIKNNPKFTGWIMSDWDAQHSTVAAANNGLDQEMPDSTYFGSALPAAVAAGQVSQATIDDKIVRILTPMFQMGLFDRAPSGSLDANVTSAAHNQLTRELAGRSSVLLKNNGVLPLTKSTTTKYALIGATATNPITGGGGSGAVVPYYQSTPLDAVAEVLASLSPARPANCTLYPGIDFYQPGNPSAPGSSPQDCCAQCAARPMCVAFAFSGGNTCWFKPNMDGKRTSAGVTAGVCTTSPSFSLSSYTGDDVAQAVATAKAADVVIALGATTSHEGADRDNLNLQNNEDAIISAVTAAVPNTVVVFVTPGPLLTPWSDDAGAVLTMLMPGQEYGHAMADILFGDVNPSGKLTITMPNKENEMEMTQSQWPGLPANNPENATYTEKLEVGYRWYDAHNVTPKFAFGHGLSYTTFDYSSLSVSGRTVSFSLKNSGSVAGAEVAQLYVGFPAASGEPPKQLKGFDKVTLAPGVSQTVSFTLTDRDLSIWDITTHNWAVQSGTFNLMVGASSRDIRLTGTLSN